MPLFIKIAGAGSWFAQRRRSARQFAVERTKRLLVPFLFASVVSLFIYQYYEWENRVYRGVMTVNFPQYLEASKEYFLSLGFSPVWLAIGGHLWFLGFLYAFAILSLPLFMWFKGQKGERLISWLAGVCEKRGGLLFFFLPLFLLRALITPIFPMEHDWGDFIFQGAFFVLGFILFANDCILRAVRRDGWLLGGIGLAAVLSLMTIYLLGNPVDDWYEAYGTPPFYLVMAVFTLVGLAWSLALLFIGMRYLDKDWAWVRYAQDIALPFFIVHQPVILFFASFIVKWDTGIPLKMLVTVASSFLVSWALVEFIIKRVGFLRFLFGMTSGKPQVKPIPAT
jgi:hypothetical protein